jgi:hypothetical protein
VVEVVAVVKAAALSEEGARKGLIAKSASYEEGPETPLIIDRSAVQAVLDMLSGP